MNIDYGEDELEKEPTSKEGLAQLSRLVLELSKQRVVAAQAEETAKEEKKKMEELAQIAIPDLMEELGVESVKVSGMVVEVVPKVRARISDATREGAAAWLRENNLDKLLKNEFSLKLNTGEEAQAQLLREKLEELNLPYKNKLNVAPQTLGKFIRERDAEGEPVPDDLFNIYRYKEAKIKI